MAHFTIIATLSQAAALILAAASAFQSSGHNMVSHVVFPQANSTELASPLSMASSYARIQTAVPQMQPAAPMAKTSKVATFTSATLSKAATLKNRVLAPSATIQAYQPGHESLPSNRGDALTSSDFGVFVNKSRCFALQHKQL